jgi:choline transport protein
MVAYVFNAALTIVAGVTVIFCLGDVNEVLANTELTPFITIFLSSTKSKAATTIRGSSAAILIACGIDSEMQ